MWKGNPGWEDKKSGEERLHEVSVLRLYYSNAMCIKESLKNDPQSKWYFNSKYHKDQRKFKSNSELFNKGQWEVDGEKRTSDDRNFQ